MFPRRRLDELPYFIKHVIIILSMRFYIYVCTNNTYQQLYLDLNQ